jgi:phosphopantothenoylcysteine decarboxylase/phosphopantothenate--cysteine ligase
MRFLVTAGPTREAIDPVRYLSNRSSGRMGYALAQALLDAGHEVVLVSGPVALEPPAGAQVEDVESAREMLAACERHWPDCDGVFGVAAVADYRPAEQHAGKLKRREGEGRTLELVPNPDVLATLAAAKGARLAVGFALESEDGEAYALDKLRRKNLDLVALNGPEAQGAAESALLLLDAEGRRHALGPAPKETLARELATHALILLRSLKGG